MEITAAAPVEVMARIVAAARLCFARDGVRRATMAQIAEEAGMVRQTVYTYVAGRDELAELALAQRLRELARVVDERQPPDLPLRAALAECLALMTEAVRDDPECGALLAAMTPDHAAEFVTGSPRVQEIVVDVLAPYVTRAQTEDVLRPGLSLEEMGWWTRTVLFPLSGRRSLSARALRDSIMKFAIPAFLLDDS